eukprot:GHVL01002446.1.p1 GENE.GHVL01002446.1~~GHVL01002446.1.p1  ORF type:complete len:150 (+),score=24.37 GHVL01002446.1:50-499(+)
MNFNIFFFLLICFYIERSQGIERKKKDTVLMGEKDDKDTCPNEKNCLAHLINDKKLEKEKDNKDKKEAAKKTLESASGFHKKFEKGDKCPDPEKELKVFFETLKDSNLDEKLKGHDCAKCTLKDDKYQCAGCFAYGLGFLTVLAALTQL